MGKLEAKSLGYPEAVAGLVSRGRNVLLMRARTSSSLGGASRSRLRR
jgi:hypothetical protein